MDFFKKETTTIEKILTEQEEWLAYKNIVKHGNYVLAYKNTNDYTYNQYKNTSNKIDENKRIFINKIIENPEISQKELSDFCTLLNKEDFLDNMIIWNDGDYKEDRTFEEYKTLYLPTEIE